MSQQTTPKKRNDRLRWVLWSLAGFLSLTVPLTTVLIVNRARYFTTSAEVLKISVGGMICLVLIALLVFGKLRVPGGLVSLAIVYGLSVLLESILRDLTLLSGIALCSKAVDSIFFAPRARAAKERITIEKTADATAGKVTAVLDQYFGRT